MLKKIIKLVIVLSFLYLFASPSFISSIVFGKQVKATCAVVRSMEAEKWPSVLHCSVPLYNETLGTYYYFVYVNKPPNWNDYTLTVNNLAGGTLNGDVYGIEDFSPGGNNTETGEVIDYPVAEWTEDNQKIKIRRNGAFAIFGPHNHTITFTTNDDFVRLAGVEACAQLALGQSALNTAKMYDIYREMEVEENWESWKRSFLQTLNTQLDPSRYPIEFEGFLGTRVSSEIMSEIHKVLTSSSQEKSILLLTLDDKLVTIEDLGGLSTRGVWWADTDTEIAYSVVEQHIRDGNINGMIDLHSHPYTSAELSISRGYSTLWDLATPSITWDPEQQVWVDDIGHFEYLETKFGGNGPKIFGIEAFNLDDPNEHVIRFWKPKTTLPDFNDIPRNYFLERTNPDGKVVYMLKARYVQSSGFVEEKFTFSKDDLIIDIPITTSEVWYDFSNLHTSKFFIGEISSIWEDAMDVLDLVSTGAMTPEQGIAKIDQYLDDIEFLYGQLPGLVSDDVLHPRAYSRFDYLLKNGGPLKGAMGALKFHNLDKSDEFLQEKLSCIYRDFGEKLFDEDMDSTNEGFLLMEKLKSENYDIDPDTLELFRQHTERYNSINQKLGNLFSMVKHDIRLEMLLHEDQIPVSIKETLKSPIEMALEKPALQAIVALPGFLIGFGVAFETLGRNFKNYNAYRWGMMIKYFGISVLVSVGTTIGLGILISIFTTGILLSSIAMVIALSLFLFVVAFVLGVITAMIVFYLFMLGQDDTCDVETPWYDNFEIQTEKKTVEVGDSLKYVFYGSICDPVRYTIDLWYTDVDRTIGPYHLGYTNPDTCVSTDGRCFECTTDAISQHAQGEMIVDAIWHEGPTYSPPTFDNPTPLRVCSDFDYQDGCECYEEGNQGDCDDGETGCWMGNTRKCCYGDRTTDSKIEQSSEDCCFEGYATHDNEVGLANGDNRFMCENGVWYLCDPTYTEPTINCTGKPLPCDYLGSDLDMDGVVTIHDITQCSGFPGCHWDNSLGDLGACVGNICNSDTDCGRGICIEEFGKCGPYVDCNLFEDFDFCIHYGCSLEYIDYSFAKTVEQCEYHGGHYCVHDEGKGYWNSAVENPLPYSWCDDNVAKNCDSSAGYSYEICKEERQDTDGGKNYKKKGTCTIYGGCRNGQCQIIDQATDECIGDILNETFVQGNDCSWIFYNCNLLGTNYHCKDGRCVEISYPPMGGYPTPPTMR